MFNKILFLVFPALAMAQSPDRFSPVGNLTTERMFHTATLLNDGRVLIAGGFAVLSGWPVWASAELYDPSTRSFTATGSMRTARRDHTATLLPDGKVLIAGGGSGVNESDTPLASAELYDPVTGTFSPTGNMAEGREFHTATPLNNGKVLIAGGRGSGTAELYDPATGTFQAISSLIVARARHTATLLANGKVLINGGYTTTPDSPGSPELYDPATGAFSLTGASAYSDLFPVTSSQLTDGEVLSTLQYSCDPSDAAELYDPPTQTFTSAAKMPTQLGYSTATLLPDGKALIAGRGGQPGGFAEIYDPLTAMFTAAGQVQREEGHTATLLPDGTVLLSGGWRCCGYSVATSEIYHPPVLTPSPVLFSVSADRQGAILHASSHQLVSSGNPAVAGEALEIYGRLYGSDGSVIPPQVAIGGRMAEVLFFGNAPGYAGLNQINVRVPAGIAPSPATVVRLNYLSRPSNEVTIGIQ